MAAAGGMFRAKTALVGAGVVLLAAVGVFAATAVELDEPRQSFERIGDRVPWGARASRAMSAVRPPPPALARLERRPVTTPVARTQPKERRLPPRPEPGAAREQWIAYAREVARDYADRAAARTAGSTPIEDGFGRQVGSTEFPDERETRLPLRLSAIVNPTDRPRFAIIEHENTGFVQSYEEGTVLRPGVLPGVWVVEVEPSVVHLLDLEDNSFEYLTFEKPRRRSVRSRRSNRRGTRSRSRRTRSTRKKRR